MIEIKIDSYFSKLIAKPAVQRITVQDHIKKGGSS